MSKCVIWPVSKAAAAQAYHDATNALYEANHPEDVGGTFTYIRPDAFGQMVCADWSDFYEEPESIAALRIDAVISATVKWPEEEEEEEEAEGSELQ